MPPIDIPPFNLWDHMEMLIGLWQSVNYYVFGFQAGLLVYIIYRVVAMITNTINARTKATDR
jgi:hypothetical protein